MKSDLVEFPALFDLEKFEAVMVEWAHHAARLGGMWDSESGPQLDRPYALFTILTSEDLTGAVEMDEIDEETGDIKRGYNKLQNIRLQVEVLSDSNKPKESATHYCEKMVTALGSDLYRESLFLPNDIGVGNPTTVRRIPMLEDGTRWRSRAMFEVIMLVACNAYAVEVMPSVSSVLIDGTLVNGNPVDLTVLQSLTAP